MQMAHRYIPTSNMYITKRIGNVAPLGTMHSNQYGNGYTRVTQNGGAAPSEVTETDLYLLSAIEKLVYRVDYMEKRLLKSEQLIYYLMAGNNQNRKEIEGECVPLCPCVCVNVYHVCGREMNEFNLR